MLSKCANPACHAKLHYLRQGKIFRIDTEPLLRSRRSESDVTAPKPPSGFVQVSSLQVAADNGGMHRPEYFWLCSNCSNGMTLAIHQGSVIVVPISKPLALRAAAS